MYFFGDCVPSWLHWWLLYASGCYTLAVAVCWWSSRESLYSGWSERM